MTSLLPTPGLSNLPATIQQIIQSGFLIRFFNDALFTQLVYRSCYEPFETPTNLGQSFTFTRKGLLPIVQDPLARPSNTDLTSGLTSVVTGKEQYTVTMNEYAANTDTNMLASAVAIVDLYKENVEDLGINAGQTLDIQARRRLALAYGGGRTYVTSPVTSVTVPVWNLAGFDFVYVNGVRQLSSVANPHPITITQSGVPASRNVVGVVAGSRNNLEDSVPGTLTLDASVTVVTGDSVISSFAPQSIRPNARTTDYNLTSGDIMTLQHLIDSAAGLRSRGVPKHDDGFYHALLDSAQVSELWRDNAYQRVYQSLPDSEEFRQGAVGIAGGVKIFETQQPPNDFNINGLLVRRAIVTGKEVGYEARYAAIAKWLAMSNLSATGAVQFSPEAHVALILRTPLDKLQQVISNSWSFIGDWVCSTDSLTTFGNSNAVYKRAVMIETA